jgi:hypothetical protein
MIETRADVETTMKIMGSRSCEKNSVAGMPQKTTNGSADIVVRGLQKKRKTSPSKALTAECPLLSALAENPVLASRANREKDGHGIVVGALNEVSSGRSDRPG